MNTKPNTRLFALAHNRLMLLVLGLLLCSVASAAIPAPAWFANLQLRITEVFPLAVTQEGILADVFFEGSGDGPFIKQGTVVGVDHVLFDFFGEANLNVYLTITDKDGEQVSANITGLATPLDPGRYVLQDAFGTIINEPDPYTGVFHGTTGKFAHLIGATFDDVGFISSFSFSPAAGSVHARWQLH